MGTGSRPDVRRVGDQLEFTNPLRNCEVVSVTWIDLLQDHGKFVARLALEDVR